MYYGEYSEQEWGIPQVTVIGSSAGCAGSFLVSYHITVTEHLSSELQHFHLLLLSLP
jgi:hypothetical protein